MGINEDWNRILKLNRKDIKRQGSFSPLLFLRKGEETKLIAICGCKNGNAIKRVVRNILREQAPDLYIVAFVGWATDFPEKVFGKYPEFEHIVDMPPDDRNRVYIQLMVNKDYGLIKSLMAQIDTEGKLAKLEYGDMESKFVLSW